MSLAGQRQCNGPNRVSRTTPSARYSPCALSRQGHLENSPPFQRWVTRSPDEGQAPAGATEARDRRSAVREHPHDRRHRSRDASMVVAGARTNRSAFETRCEIIRRKIGLSSLRDFTNCCAPKPSNKLLGYFRTSLAGQRARQRQQTVHRA